MVIFIRVFPNFPSITLRGIEDEEKQLILFRVFPELINAITVIVFLCDLNRDLLRIDLRVDQTYTMLVCRRDA